MPVKGILTDQQRTHIGKVSTCCKAGLQDVRAVLDEIEANNKKGVVYDNTGLLNVLEKMTNHLVTIQEHAAEIYHEHEKAKGL